MKCSGFVLTAFVGASMTAYLGSARAATPGLLRAGVATADITPENEGEVLDPLQAKALVFLQGDQRAALVMCDLIGVSETITAEARKLASGKTGIPAANIAIAATHTHNGRHGHPDAAQRIARAVAEAFAAAKPVELQSGTGTQEETISFNRRFLMKDGTIRFNPGSLNPDILRPVGPIDHEVGILMLRSPDGRPVAGVVNFALHACTMGRPGWSADYPHFLETSLQKDFGDQFVCLYAPGACGDVNHFDVSRPRAGRTHYQGQTFLTPYEPIKTDRPPSPLTSEYLGAALGATVGSALPKLEAVQQPSLAVRSAMVRVPLATYSQMDLDWAREASRQKTSFLVGVRAKRILALEEMRRQGDSIALEIQAIRLGSDTAIVTLPGEIFVELGLALKKASPFRTTLVVELAETNKINYVPTRKAFVEGEYEVVNSRLECGGGEMLVDAALGLLRELNASGS